MFGFLRKLFGNKHERDITEIRPIVDQVNEEYKKLSSLSHDQLRNKTLEFRQIIKDYLKDIGVKNVFVVALASNNPQDKADWIEDRIDNDGYDDIFFADDSPKNVSVTKKMLSSKPNIKYRVQHIKY